MYSLYSVYKMDNDKDNGNFHIFIASCVEGLDFQVPRIVKNILESNIPTKYVHIIVGGCPYNGSFHLYDIEVITVTYRCFEFTPLIYIACNPEKINFDFGFFTHDTVSFGKGFYNLMKEQVSYLRTTSYDTMRLDIEMPSMNIGIYSKNIIAKNTSKLLEIMVHTNDRDELISLKHKLSGYEDFIFYQNNYTNHTNVSEKTEKVLEGIYGSVSNGLIRNFKYYDFIKYQSNAHYIQSIDICKID